ncbi:MAG: hypothetical protein R3E67_05685 [Pseudomonadales bacterium]
MKKIILLSSLLCALFAGQRAHAYYLEHAVAGVVTLEVTGACAIPKIKTEAYIADISDDEHNPLGWGIVTASGHLIALREKAVAVVDKKNFANNQQRTTDYIDLTGATLKTFLTKNGVRCEIAHLQMGVNSTLTSITSSSGGRAVLRATIAGYEIQRCTDSGDVQNCAARRINGKIGFTGKW